MQIAFFTENIQFGGLDTFIINLLNNWDKSDEITLICNSSHPGLKLLKERLNPDVNIIEHKIPLVWDLRMYFPSTPKLILKILKFLYFLVSVPIQIYLLKKNFQKNKFDKMMVINGGYPGGDSCLSATIAWGNLYPENKVWHNFHNLAYGKNDYRGVDKLKYFRSYLIDILVQKYSKGFVSVSKSSMDSLNVRSNFRQVKKKFIYNGIDVDESMNNIISIKEKYNLPSDAKVISMLGVYESRKGQDFLIRAFLNAYKINKNLYLFMFGKGKKVYISYLQQLIGKNENIYLENYQDDIKQIFAGTDILIIPSQALESFGYTAVEAMAYKVPIIATNVGGLPEVVENNKCGYIIEKDNLRQLEDKILCLALDSRLRNKFGEAGYIRYKKLFNAKKMSNEYKKLIMEE